MTHCAVHSCKTSIYNKTPGISLHSCPQDPETRSKWLVLLRSKCPMLDWATSKICSKHFENKYFDSQRRLKENAIPKLFAAGPHDCKMAKSPITKNKWDKVLSRMTQTSLTSDIKNSLTKLKVPSNLNEFSTIDLQPKPDAPMEAKLWILVKKQEHLNSRLTDLVLKNRERTDALHKSVTEAKNSKKELDKNLETYKYIVKCLQEKQASLEEQIEILTAVESR